MSATELTIPHYTIYRRFLRARKFDLAKAKIMWIDFINWRNEFKVDELYEHFEYPELVEVDKLYPKFYHKTDKVSLIRCATILGQCLLTSIYTGRKTRIH